MLVVVWEDGGVGLGNDVKARLYHADGTPATGEITVNQVAAGNQRTPAPLIPEARTGGDEHEWLRNPLRTLEYLVGAVAYSSSPASRSPSRMATSRVGSFAGCPALIRPIVMSGAISLNSCRKRRASPVWPRCA